MAKESIHTTLVAGEPRGAIVALSLPQLRPLPMPRAIDEGYERPVRGAAVDKDPTVEAASARGSNGSGNPVVGGKRAFKQSVIDATLAARIKTLLLASNKTSGKAIDVKSKGGIVSLSGTVHSETEKEFAGRIARSTTGVKAVRNRLVVETG